MERPTVKPETDRRLTRRRLMQLAAMSAGAMAVGAALPRHVEISEDGIAIHFDEASAATTGTLTLQPATADTFVQEDTPTTNYGSFV